MAPTTKSQTKSCKKVDGEKREMEEDLGEEGSVCASTSDSVNIIQESLAQFQKNFDSKFETKFTNFSETLKNDIVDTIDAAVSRAVQKQLDEFRAEFREDINRLSERLVAVEKDQAEVKMRQDEMGKKQTEMNQRQLSYADVTTLNSKRVVIKNLPESESESTKDRVRKLFIDVLGLKNDDINIESAVRQGDPQVKRNYARVIVATMKSKEEVGTIMKKKSQLKDKEHFKKVYIDYDRPAHERKAENNMRTLVNTLAKDKLRVKGGRVCQKENMGN